ncbi:MAG: YqgE/AlgH family protein [Nitrospirae bacterium]|nr:YqgE/AlgH family protein [Candidatus Manganitrophaceae bacterium]
MEIKPRQAALILAWLFLTAAPPFVSHGTGEAAPSIENRSPPQTARPGKQVEKGVFLIADRRLLDPNFAETVVLITAHGTQGSVGVVINRPTATPLARAFPTVKAFENRSERLFIGGPVQREVMIFLFRTDAPPESSIPIFERVYSAPIIDTLSGLISRGRPNDRFRIYSGYAGWGPGQLEHEIDRGDWRLLPGEAERLFKDETDSIWEELFRRSSQQSVKACGRIDPCTAPIGPGLD